MFNSFNPEVLKKTILILHLDTHSSQKGDNCKSRTERQTVLILTKWLNYELCNLDLHYLQKCLTLSTGLKGLKECSFWRKNVPMYWLTAYRTMSAQEKCGSVN